MNNMTKFIQKHIYIIISILVLLVILICFQNSNPVSFLNDNLFANLTNNKKGYTCDRYAGICEVDETSPEYLDEKQCQAQCSKLRYQWYCNETIGQCTRDFRGKYNNYDSCWSNCYDKVTYYCDATDGTCKAGMLWGGTTPTLLLQNAYMTIDECGQKCKPIKNVYIYNSGTRKCAWDNTGAYSGYISWDDCTNKSGSNGSIKFTQSNGKCVPTPTGEFDTLRKCTQALPNEYAGYTGFNCNYSEGKCYLSTGSAEFKATTMEDAYEICKYNCMPNTDKEIIEDYKYRTTR